MKEKEIVVEVGVMKYFIDAQYYIELSQSKYLY